jgi:transposase
MTPCVPRSWPQPVADAYRDTATALLGVITALSAQIAELEAALGERLEQHPDADILRSLPGLGLILGARVLSQFGDDPNRYRDAKARRNYAGSSPITKQSGKRRVVLARYVRNRRLADALTHHQALRALSNRWVGILHGCLRHRTLYDNTPPWGTHDEKIHNAA